MYRPLFVLPVEFFDHLIGEVERIAMIEDDLQRAFTTLIDDEGIAAFFRD